MIPRYTNPEMGRIWSDQRRYETWLQVETAAAEAMARAGIVPVEAAQDIRAKGAFDIARIEAIEAVTQHDVIAFTTAVAEHVGPSARWMHFGMTSSDVIDTAQALQMREACDLVLKGLSGLMTAIRARAEEHRRTPMIGRTHGVHAEPMTLGLKLALWYAELDRDVARDQRARARSCRSASCRAPSAPSPICRRRSSATSAQTLGLTPAPVASQVIQRDRHAELLSALAITASTLEKCALEIRGLQKTEIGEVEEPFAKGQKGSSAMPHKRNPIGCEQIVGLARLVRANAMAAMENNALVARARHLALVGRARHPAGQLHRAGPHAAPLDAHRGGHGGVSGSHAREPGALARRRVLGHGAARAGAARRVARAGLRVGAAERDALVRRARAVPGRCSRRTPTSRACCRRGTSRVLSTSTNSCGTWTTFSIVCSRAWLSDGPVHGHGRVVVELPVAGETCGSSCAHL